MNSPGPVRCFREPIPAIFDAARYLDAAVAAHISGRRKLAEQLLTIANDQAVWNWTDSIWGKKSSYVRVPKWASPAGVTKEPARMPTADQKAAVHRRDGYHCRYCGMPVIRAEIRKYLQSVYPKAVQWGKTNASQHAAFQAMWAQYDHVVPHTHGGTNELGNLVLACAACNFGKWHYTLEELGITDPRLFPPESSGWDGLERVLPSGGV